MSAEPFVSYAQHGEDVVLWRALGDREKVTYVDVGAFDPTYDSVTRALYDRGWRGVNIEAQPARLEAFERDRPEDTNLSMAIGDKDGEAVLTLPTNPGWASLLDSSVTGSDEGSSQLITVPVRRLATVFRDLGLEHVDVLKIDVEGAEPGVVRGLLDGDVRPVVCVVEGVAPGLGRQAGDEAVALLVEAGYVHCMFDGLNHYLTTDESLRESLSLPANPVDGFVTDHVYRLSHERDALTASITALAQENSALRRGVGHLDVGPTPQATKAPAASPAPRATERPAPSPAARREPRPTSATAGPTPRFLDPRVRAKRRRETFEQLLTGHGDEPLPEMTGAPLPRILRLSSGGLAPKDAVDVLYREILGRAPDPDGLLVWAGRVEKGEALFDLASEMAATEEARGRTRSDIAVVRADLRTWERLIAVEALGLGSWRGLPGETAASVGHRIFVNALFEVSLQRAPRPDERALEVGKLVGGVGREWLLRAYAARPETDRRLFGTGGGGVRGRVRSLRDRRRRLEIFRELVAAAESRQLTLLLVELSQAETDSASIPATPSSETP